MRILLIRHAEPDYTNDSITEKGYRLYRFLWLHGADVRIFFKKAAWYLKAGIKKALGIKGTEA